MERSEVSALDDDGEEESEEEYEGESDDYEDDSDEEQDFDSDSPTVPMQSPPKRRLPAYDAHKPIKYARKACPELPRNEDGRLQFCWNAKSVAEIFFGKEEKVSL